MPPQQIAIGMQNDDAGFGHLIKILWQDGIGIVALRQTAGAREVHLDVAGRRNDCDHHGAAGLFA
jgi:hypothetical protein